MLFTVKILLLLLIFGSLFSVLPKYVHREVMRLLTYHRKEKFMVRLGRVLRVYLVMGLILGIVFYFLLSPNVFSTINEIKPTTFTNDNIQLFGLSFILSFALVFIIRISSLLSKTNIYCFFLGDEKRGKVKRDNLIHPYNDLKKEISSFLFSIFLSALLGLMVYFFYKLIFYPDTLLSLSLEVTAANLANYAIFVIIFVICLAVLTLIGELLLCSIGIRPNCYTEVKTE